MKAIITGLTLALFALAPPLVRAVNGASLETRHGFVVDKQRVDDGSTVLEGAVIGGVVGLGTAVDKSGSTRVRRTVGGAVLGAIVAGQLDRSRRYWVYTVRFPGGDEQPIATQDDRLRVGDCATVRYGVSENTVSYTSDYFCQRDRTGEEGRAADERRCLEARKALLAAESDEETDRWSREVRARCPANRR